MAHDSVGTQNQPQYASAGTPASAADLSEISNYAAKVGNRKTGTNAQRTALTGADVWDGLQFRETDTKMTYVYITGTGWVIGDGVVRHYRGALSGAIVAPGTVFATQLIPAVAVAKRVVIRVIGGIASTSGGAAGVSVATTAGTVTADGIQNGVSSSGTAYASLTTVDIPANSAATITLKIQGSVSAGVVGAWEMQVLLAGEY